MTTLIDVSAGNPKQTIRVDPELWKAFGEVCDAKGTSRAEDIREHMEREVQAYEQATNGPMASPLDLLRAAVREQGGEWTAKRAVAALETAYKGRRSPTAQRARELLNKLAAEGLLVKHGKIGRLWTPATREDQPES